MKKAILIDMGDTLIHNINIDFTNAILYLYDVTKKCNVDKLHFVSESVNILNTIFNERKNLEFKMKEYIQLLIDLYNLEFDVDLNELEEGFAFNSCKMEIIDGVEDILQYFNNKKYPVILLSNTSFSKPVILKMLGKLSIYFEEIIVSSENVFRKPSEFFFKQGINKFKDNSKEIYYIGNDFYHDIFGAYNAGIKPIWFKKYGTKKDENLNVGDYIEIESYYDLIYSDF